MFFKQLTSSSGLINTTTGFSLTSSSGSSSSLVIPLTKDNCGQISYTRPGTYAWVCPYGVSAVSVVCIGGGGGGYDSWSNLGGAGGGLGWKNNIPVLAGMSYTVVVGVGGSRNGVAGGNSYFISLTTVAGYGGGNGTSGADTNGPNKNGYGGGWYGDGGGAGGNSYYSGGGAGGYSGNGGTNGAAAANSGGAAGGRYYSSTYGVGGGGGTGIHGKGETGLGWYYGRWIGSTSTSIAYTLASDNTGGGGGGEGGSGGSRGMSGENTITSSGEGNNNGEKGGLYGGGGGGPGSSWPTAGTGGWGAVKLIWTTVPIDSNNPGRLFPSTYTADIS